MKMIFTSKNFKDLVKLLKDPRTTARIFVKILNIELHEDNQGCLLI